MLLSMAEGVIWEEEENSYTPTEHTPEPSLKKAVISGIVGRFSEQTFSFAGSSNGRTPPSGGGYLGSSPGPAAKQ